MEAEPPRKKRKLSTTNNAITCSDNSNNGAHGSDTRDKNQNVLQLMQSIENEADEMMEKNVLQQIINILRSEISQNKSNYSLYLKLSWAYLRSGRYEEALSYFDHILPRRDHDKFYDFNALKATHTRHKSTKSITKPDNINDRKQNDINDDESSDLEMCIKKNKEQKKRKQRKKRLKKFQHMELNIARLNKRKIHSVSTNCATINTEKSIPLAYETSIRVNIALMLCRICDYEEALRQTFIMRDLYQKEFVNNHDAKDIRYDPYIDFIQMLVAYHQKLWYQSIANAVKILSHQNIKKTTKKKSRQQLICKLDNHSLFELYCVLGDSYSCVGDLEKADHIFEDIILPHMKLDLSVKFHWIYEIYLRHLYHKKDWQRGYTLCMKLFAHHISYRYNANMMRLGEMFNIQYHFKGNQSQVYHFVIDAQYFGNQSRFVNHSEDIKCLNCGFVVRYKFGNTSCPSAIEVWLKSTKKIEKRDELLVNYGQNYWQNVQNTPKLKKRNKWDEGFVFTHLILDEMAAISCVGMKQWIERHHAVNKSLCDKTYPNCIEVKKDEYDGFGCFATRTIKKDTFILRYAGIRKLSTDLDQSHSRYAIEVRKYDI